jgi:RNA polymerase sigma-70 factor, ECF subfamily
MHKYQQFDDEMRLRLLSMEAEQYASLDADWQRLYDAEVPRVLAYFGARLNDPALAEDLTAETFARAWHSRERYEAHRASFATWLLSIARHVLIDTYRQHYRAAAVRPDDETSISAEEGIDQQRDFGRLAHLLNQLPERERTLISLKYVEGLTNRLIAKRLNLSESNVGTILHRAMQMLRTLWQHDGEMIA